MRRFWPTGLLVVALGAAVGGAGALASGSLLRGEIYALRVRVDRATTLDPERKAFLGQRLYDDDALLDQVARPDWMSKEEFEEYNARIVALDRQLVEGALSGRGTQTSAGKIRGNGAFWMRSNVDGAWQAVSVYVPASYDASRPTRLIVYLHGKGEAENRVTAKKINRDLADHCGCIIAAPYARGQTQYADPAPADIYQLRELMLEQFTIDRERIYLVGYSMGGFGVFEVGRYHPERWTAFLAIAGGLTGDDRMDVARTFGGKRVYMVSGTKDEDIPNAHIRKSVDDLRAHGIETKYYEVPGASHYTYTMVNAIGQAWNDMLAGAPGSLTPLGQASTSPLWAPRVAPAPPARKT